MTPACKCHTVYCQQELSHRSFRKAREAIQAEREFCVDIDLNQDVADWFDEHIAKSSPFHQFNSPAMCKGKLTYDLRSINQSVWSWHRIAKQLLLFKSGHWGWVRCIMLFNFLYCFQSLTLSPTKYYLSEFRFTGAKLYLTNVALNAQDSEQSGQRCSLLSHCCGIFAQPAPEDVDMKAIPGVQI